MALLHYTLHCLYLILLYSATFFTAICVSTSLHYTLQWLLPLLYYSLLRLYFPPLHSTLILLYTTIVALLDSTLLYYTLPQLYLCLLDSTTLSYTVALIHSHITLLISTMALYFHQLHSTLAIPDSTLLYILHSTMAIIVST